MLSGSWIVLPATVAVPFAGSESSSTVIIFGGAGVALCVTVGVGTGGVVATSVGVAVAPEPGVGAPVVFCAIAKMPPTRATAATAPATQTVRDGGLRTAGGVAGTSAV